MVYFPGMRRTGVGLLLLGLLGGCSGAFTAATSGGSEADGGSNDATPDAPRAYDGGTGADGGDAGYDSGSQADARVDASTGDGGADANADAQADAHADAGGFLCGSTVCLINQACCSSSVPPRCYARNCLACCM